MGISIPWAPLMQKGWFSEAQLSQAHKDRLAWGTILCVAAHLPHAPLWVMIAAGASLAGILLPRWATQFWCERQNVVQTVKHIALIGSLIAIFMHFGTWIGRDPGTAILITLSGLKLLECQYTRDLYVGVYLAYMLCLTALFFNQSTLLVAYLLCIVPFITSVLWYYNSHREALSWMNALRPTCKVFLKAIPLMVCLFILFPRISGPLWGLPEENRVGLTGISDNMEPGSMSELARSDKIAFRVEFTGPIPEQRHLYWRGPVMVHTDGRRWSADKGHNARRGLPEVSGIGIEYALIQEASDLEWIYALEMPGTLPKSSYLSRLHEIKSWRPLRARKRYVLSAHTDYQLHSLPRERRRALKLPDGAHPRARQLAESWTIETTRPVALAQRALNYFRYQGFRYTLRPDVILGDPVDGLLFDSRRGFCEHYAAAFVVLMRAAGVPARVVTGYQGGELNPVANYLIIRQFHAHAWAEVWLDDESGWVRVDPTAVVAPERINVGVEEAVPELGTLFPPLFGAYPQASRLWNRLSNSWMAINYHWTRWILSYDRNHQNRLLSRLGFTNMDTVSLSLMTLSCLLLLPLAWAIWNILRYSTSEDAAQRAYNTFCSKLAKLGVQRNSSETPNHFAKRLQALEATGWQWGYPEAIVTITNRYMEIRYGSKKEHLATLRSAVARFQPYKPAGKPQQPCHK